MEEYNLHDFEKQKVIDLIEKIRSQIGEKGIVSGVIHVQPWRFRLNLQTNQSLTEVIYDIYNMDEVCEVSLGADAAGRMPYVDVTLKPGWYEEDKNERPFSGQSHPEKPGGEYA